MPSLTYILQQIAIYWGVFILISGLLGNLFNLIVFLSLKTFRQSSCALYLTVMSFFNIGQLIESVLSRIMITGFNIDWTQTSLFYCKFRTMFLHLCSLTSFTCMCLAIIDQFMATSSRRQLQQLCNIKIAYCLSLIMILIWICHEIPTLILFNLIQSSDSSEMTCTNTSFVYQQYIIYVYLLVLTGILPMFINILFGSLAYRHVSQIPYRTIPLVRRALDKQLTSMVLVQMVYSVTVVSPLIAVNILIRSTTLSNDPVINERLTFANFLAGYLYYMCFVVRNRFIDDCNCKIRFLFFLRVHFTFIFVFPNDFDNNLSMLFFKLILNKINKEELLLVK